MKSSRSARSLASVLSVALAVAGCHDGPAAPPVKPAAIAVSAGSDQSGVVGQKLPSAPTFVVRDAGGNALAGVPVSVAVTSGGGVITDAPDRSAAGPTSIGTWTLGAGAGIQSITVIVEGLPPLVISARAAAGAPARLVAVTSATFAVRAGDVPTPAPSARVTDQFGNAVPGAVVKGVVAGFGTAPATFTADTAGIVSLADWQVGTVAGQSALQLSAGTATASFVANITAAAAATIAVEGASQRPFAGEATTPIILRVTDRFGNSVGAQTASFSVAAGSGSLASTSAASAADGSITMPAWTMARTAATQTVVARIGDLTTNVSVQPFSNYKIDVRFFGDPMTDAQKAWFTNAAARISGAVTGDVPDITVAGLPMADVCGIPGLPTMDETIDDIVIYASVSAIDGPGKILAEAGPCVFRTLDRGGTSLAGVMLFDSADMDKMAAQNITQEVITHEMLHVVGVGTLWQGKNLLANAGTAAVTYLGTRARQQCVSIGGGSTCATTVPVENNLVPGTSDSHWRETTFGNELMTGYANVGGMPFSAITIGGLADIGYQVNLLAADPFVIPGTAGPTGNRIPAAATAEEWERLPPAAVVIGNTPGEAPRYVRRPTP